MNSVMKVLKNTKFLNLKIKMVQDILHFTIMVNMPYIVHELSNYVSVAKYKRWSI